MKDDLDREGRDMEVASYLSLLDPASSDPNYWMRFQSRVLRDAAPELARRRVMADLTVGDVLTAWSRTLVPAAVLAAAMAGLIAVRSPAVSGPVAVEMGVEELLVLGIDDDPIPVALESDESAATLAFAGDRF
ncbi:MAG TPA: hypothetical protein VLA36_00775 [Longimicrobiales bacterium]|nr:hypothetical protein [Longimicrobiales bacterium]